MTLPLAPTNPQSALLDLLFVLLIIGAPVAYRWAKARQAQALAFYRAHTTVQQRIVLDGLAKDAVAWAERFASSPAGKQKLQQAIALVQAGLKARGITIDVTEVEAAIQAEVAAMKANGVLAAAGPSLAAQAPLAPTPGRAS